MGYGYDLIAEHYDETISKMDNARNLHALDNKRSIRGWENAIYKWLENGKQSPLQDDVSAPLNEVNKSYHYDEINDVYYTFLSIADRMVAVDGDKHRAMKEAYSNMVGKAASMNEIARVWYSSCLV